MSVPNSYVMVRKGRFYGGGADNPWEAASFAQMAQNEAQAAATEAAAALANVPRLPHPTEADAGKILSVEFVEGEARYTLVHASLLNTNFSS